MMLVNDGQATTLRRGDAVDAASAAIRDLIGGRELLPGQQLRQDDLAERLGLGRGPTREALQALRKEGIVTHAKNRGYMVARLDYFQMQQVYQLRDLVESEVLRSLPKPTVKQVASLRGHNKRLSKQTQASDIFQVNETLHFEMFELSPLKVLVAQVDRLWRMAAAYRTLVVAGPLLPLHDIVQTHEDMLDALASHDLEMLVKLAGEYRAKGLENLRAAMI